MERVVPSLREKLKAFRELRFAEAGQRLRKTWQYLQVHPVVCVVVGSVFLTLLSPLVITAAVLAGMVLFVLCSGAAFLGGIFVVCLPFVVGVLVPMVICSGALVIFLNITYRIVSAAAYYCLKLTNQVLSLPSRLIQEVRCIIPDKDFELRRKRLCGKVRERPRTRLETNAVRRSSDVRETHGGVQPTNHRDEGATLPTLPNSLNSREGRMSPSPDALATREMRMARSPDTLTTRERRITRSTDGLGIREGRMAWSPDTLTTRDRRMARSPDTLTTRDRRMAWSPDTLTTRDGRMDWSPHALITREGRMATSSDVRFSREGIMDTLRDALISMEGRMDWLPDALISREGRRKTTVTRFCFSVTEEQVVRMCCRRRH